MKKSSTGKRFGPNGRVVGFLTIFLLLSYHSIALAEVFPGLDAIAQEHFASLQGKRVGLIANQTSRSIEGTFAADLMLKEKSVQLVALFGPEHGLFGERAAGVTSDASNVYKGVPVYSLYGSTRKPTAKMLAGIDVLVFDIQDIGVRPYTYVSTMILAMEAAAEHDIAFYVLDRPNPLSGERVEGNVIEPDLKSFVGQLPIPYIHGMTIGELATMAVGMHWFANSDKLKLTIIPMTDWKRSMTWSETGLEWRAPSPNIPHAENVVGAAMFGALGELAFVSIGINTDHPFLRLGSSMKAGKILPGLAKQLLPKECKLTSESFSAKTSDGAKKYAGIRVTLPSDWSTIPELYKHQFELIHALLKNPTFRDVFNKIPEANLTMFQKVTGTHSILQDLKDGIDPHIDIRDWEKDESEFRIERQKYLLYR